MSEELQERIYTINLGKVMLTPHNKRAKRAINMIREFASKNMKSEKIKIDQEVSHLIWSRGIRHPPRKIRVKITKDDDDNIMVSTYQEEKKIEKEEKKAVEKPKKEEKKIEKEEKKAEEKPKKEEKKVTDSKSGKK